MIETHDMTHWETMVRWIDSLTDENIDRSDATFAYLRVALCPKMPVDATEIGSLRAARLRRSKTFKINVKKNLHTRDRRLTKTTGVVLTDDAAAEKYTMDHLRSLDLAARRANVKLLGLVRKDVSGDSSTFSLCRGSTYLKRFLNASEAQKATF